MFTVASDKNTHGAQDGFTLVELIITIMLLAILGVAAFTRLRDSTGPIRLRAAIDQITSDIELSKSFAMARHDTITIVYNSGSDNYQIFSGPTGSRTALSNFPGSNNGTVSLAGLEYTGVDISAVSFNGGNELSFDPWGNALSGGTVTLNGTEVITIHSLTGYWEISE